MCGTHHLHTHRPDTREQTSAETTAVAEVATRPCPSCGRPVQEDFVLCPYCGTQLKRSCPSCRRAVEVEWNVCSYCGADLTETGA